MSGPVHSQLPKRTTPKVFAPLQLRHPLLLKLTKTPLRQLHLQLCRSQRTQSGAFQELCQQHIQRQRGKHESTRRGNLKDQVRRTRTQKQPAKTRTGVQKHSHAARPRVHSNEKITRPEVRIHQKTHYRKL